MCKVVCCLLSCLSAVPEGEDSSPTCPGGRAQVELKPSGSRHRVPPSVGFGQTSCAPRSEQRGEK